MINQYDVVDTNTGEALYIGLSRRELKEATGIGENYIKDCVDMHTAYKGKYYIVARGMGSWEERFREDWTAITEMLK